MLETQFSLSWEQHMHNICYGLNKFQQNGEFVDMTLAAEGSFVKAHQMILCLVSPYIKDIIASLKGTHPVLFFDNISYKTLCSVLDYVYKGEVEVSKEQLNELINAGKVLQIKGLQEMSASTTLSSHQTAPIVTSNNSEDTNEMTKLETTAVEEPEKQSDTVNKDRIEYDDINESEFVIEDNENEAELLSSDDSHELAKTNNDKFNDNSFIVEQDTDDLPTPFFTTSNQGSLQLVLDRYLYFLKYKSMSASGHSQWKCVNYNNSKCPAYVITKNDKVIQKHSKHAHPNHDIRIAQKVASGELFPSMKSAEELVKTKKVTNSRREKRKK